MSSRGSLLTALVLAALVLVTGCGIQRDPTAYSDTVRADFVRECAAQQVSANGAGAKADATTVCECAYKNLSTNVKYDVFQSADDQLKEDPTGTLPPVLLKQVEPCAGGATQPSTTGAPAAEPTTTVTPG